MRLSAPRRSVSLGDLHHLVVGETHRRLHLLLVEQRGHLDVVGGRERIGWRERERKEEVPDSQESSCGHLQSLLEIAKSVVFKCFFAQKNFPQSLAVTKSEDCLREINKSFFPSLSVYSHPGL